MKMLNRKNLHAYQEHSVEHILQQTHVGLFHGLGLGKSCITLTAIDELIYNRFEVSKVLIIAPKRVAEHTWKEEISTWSHVNHLRLSIILGTQRARAEALRAKADIYAINRENVAWLVSYLAGAWPFDMVVVDESSSFKDQSSQRFKALRTVLPKIKRMVILTATPRPNSLLDLWPQIYLLDQGARLGKTLTSFRDGYFDHSSHGGGPGGVYSVKKPDFLKIEKTDTAAIREAKKNAANPYEQEIYRKISDICISMKSADYLTLPKRIDRIKTVELSPETMKRYLEFEESLVLSMPEVEDISVLSAVGLTNKLRQFANGAVYDDDKQWHLVHNDKLDALEEHVEAANGEPMLVFYQYQHDRDRIMQRFAKLRPVLLKGPKEINDWNDGKLRMMISHEQSAGHGLNLQRGGHLLSWFGNSYSSEYYQQGVGRVDRQGQKFPVINTRFVCAGTIDLTTIAAVEEKITGEKAMLEAVKAIIKKYK